MKRFRRRSYISKEAKPGDNPAQPNRVAAGPSDLKAVRVRECGTLSEIPKRKEKITVESNTLINLKNFENSKEIIELLNESMFASEEKVNLEYEKYMNDTSRMLLGITKGKKLVGLIGIIYLGKEKVELKHIAIKKEERRQGIGKKLIMEFMKDNAIRRIEAETDTDAVNFYRSIGFQVRSLGEKYPGVERFKCIKDRP